ncbi:MAG: carbon starvation protein A [Kiritimatiellaeota bacterium]|nr:carbon starvation protein A [Kiritimatiellota bacterium]
MNSLILLGAAAVILAIAYCVYGRVLARWFEVDDKRPTPAHTKRDGVDFVPTHRIVLFGHHFASIAGAGPIVGPILAIYFGWGAVAIWLLVGCIFIGGLHDFSALILSVRNKGVSVATLIENYIGRSGRILFLSFCSAALILIIAVFAGMVADTFAKVPAVATSSLLFIAIAPLFGCVVTRLKVPLWLGSLVFVPLTFFCVFVGNWFPLDIQGLGIAEAHVRTAWILLLMFYCAVAATLPVWLLLQPRDYLNSWLLYAMILFGVLGIALTRPAIELPAFTGFVAPSFEGVGTCAFPFLFITVACGACSGFHALVASGTTSKQLARERDALSIGYGGMLLEALLGIIAIISVAWLGKDALTAAVVGGTKPPQLFAGGLQHFGAPLGLPEGLGGEFVMLALAAFLMTTLDTATRIARLTFEELLNRPSSLVPRHSNNEGRKTKDDMLSAFRPYLVTAVVVALSALLALTDAMTLWPVFGAANQLLAALVLLVATLWLIRKRKRAFWATLLPMAFMLAVSATGLVQMAYASFAAHTPVLGALAALLLLLTAFLLALSLRCITAEAHRR